MKTEAVPAMPGHLRRGLDFYQRETGQSLLLWAGLAALNFIAMIVLCRELNPGEFGTLNTALGMIGLMTVPALAVQQAFAWYLACNHAAERREWIESLRAARLPVTETFAVVWGGVSFFLLLILLPLLVLPRFSLQLFTMLNVALALGGMVSAVVCESKRQRLSWAGLLVASALVRVLAGAGLGGWQPGAESGLAGLLLAGCITLAPALSQPATEPALRLKACLALWDRDFLLHLGATFSILLAIFLFSSADRIVAQSWFGSATNNNLGYVNWEMFDSYQTAGLLGRAVLWGAQPLLWLLLAQRSRLTRTTAASLKYLWLYFAALFSGAIFLGLLHGPLCLLFGGSQSQSTQSFVISFSLAILPLGLLQGVAIFVLASRRYPECFLLGGCGVAYTLLLYLVGRQPQLMPAYMFGAGVVILMAVLFLAVVRWGRKQP